MPVPTGAVKWTQTFKRDGIVYRGAEVSVYLAGTTTAATIYDAGGIQKNTLPQTYTDEHGRTEFWIPVDEFPSGQLFDVVVRANSRCSANDDIVLNSLMILQDDEGGRAFHQTFYQSSPPSQDTYNLREGDNFIDSDTNHPYRWDSTIEEWVSVQDGSIALVGYSHGIFAETWEGSSRLNYWTSYSGSGSLTVTQVADSIAGGYVLRVGDNSGNDMAWLIFNSNIPFDPTRVYRIKLRVRRTAGAGTIYCGFAGVGADGETWVNITGANSYSSQHYHCAANANPGDTAWHEYEGYTYGTAAAGTGTVGTAPSGGTDNTGKMHEDVRYVRPLIIVNYNGAAGTTDIDSIIIEALPPTSEMSSYWYIDAGADVTGENTANNTSNVGGLTSGNIGNWAAADPDYLDAARVLGVLATNTIPDLSATKITSGTLTVTSDMGITVQAGGDVTFQAVSGNYSKILWTGVGANTISMYANYGQGSLLIQTNTDYVSKIYFGRLKQTWFESQSIWLGRSTIVDTGGSDIVALGSYVTAFYPYGGSCDLGTTLNSFSDCYICDGWRMHNQTGYLQLIYGAAAYFSFQPGGTGGDSDRGTLWTGDLTYEGSLNHTGWTADFSQVDKREVLQSLVDAYAAHDGSRLHPILQKKITDQKYQQDEKGAVSLAAEEEKIGKSLDDVVQLLAEVTNEMVIGFNELKTQLEEKGLVKWNN